MWAQEQPTVQPSCLGTSPMLDAGLDEEEKEKQTGHITALNENLAARLVHFMLLGEATDVGTHLMLALA